MLPRGKEEERMASMSKVLFSPCVQMQFKKDVERHVEFKFSPPLSEKDR